MNADDLLIDFFAQSGTTLPASEILKRKCFTVELDTLYAEITIRRLEHCSATGRLGWQNGHPFQEDVPDLEPDRAPLAESEPVPAQKSLF